MGSVYVALGIFLLLAAATPSAHRGLFAFTAWSRFAHAAMMGLQAYEILFCGEASGCCFGFGVVLLGMRPRLEVFGHRDPSRLLDALLKTTRCEKE